MMPELPMQVTEDIFTARECKRRMAADDLKIDDREQARLLQVARLTHENLVLKGENTKLHDKVKRLTSTIRRLRDPLVGAITVARELEGKRK